MFRTYVTYVDAYVYTCLASSVGRLRNPILYQKPLNLTNITRENCRIPPYLTRNNFPNLPLKLFRSGNLPIKESYPREARRCATFHHHLHLVGHTDLVADVNKWLSRSPITATSPRHNDRDNFFPHSSLFPVGSLFDLNIILLSFCRCSWSISSTSLSNPEDTQPATTTTDNRARSFSLFNRGENNVPYACNQSRSPFYLFIVNNEN